MAWQPFKLNSSKRAKGFQPERGWYCVDAEAKVADLSQRYEKKGEARKACKLKSSPIAAPILEEKK